MTETTAKTPQATPAKAPSVTVRLLRPHTHAGEDLEPGAKLDLNRRQADWLVEIGAAEIAR